MTIPLVRGTRDHAYWLADKIPAFGDYGKECAETLRELADRLAEKDAALQKALKDAADACLLADQYKAERDALQAHVGELEEALGFYAKLEGWDQGRHTGKAVYAVARAALATQEDKP